MFTDTGSTIYIILLIALAPFSLGSLGFVIWWFTHSHEREKPQTDQIEAIWSRRQEWGEEICRQILTKQVTLKMTPEMVRLAWSEPTQIEMRPPQGEQWSYAPDSQVIFENGQVIAVTGTGAGLSATERPMRVVAAMLAFLLFMVLSIIFGVIIYYS